MHKVLKDYVATSQGDLLHAVQRIHAMVTHQYSAYKKAISSAHLTVRFRHSARAMPYLPDGVHKLITPAAIEHVRQQFELEERMTAENRDPPCSGMFKRIFGLPCRHTMRSVWRLGGKLEMRHFPDEHWHFNAQRQRSISLPPSQYQHVLNPPIIAGRGRPRQVESSTHRDPSAFRTSRAAIKPASPDSCGSFVADRNGDAVCITVQNSSDFHIYAGFDSADCCRACSDYSIGSGFRSNYHILIAAGRKSKLFSIIFANLY